MSRPPFLVTVALILSVLAAVLTIIEHADAKERPGWVGTDARLADLLPAMEREAIFAWGRTAPPPCSPYIRFEFLPDAELQGEFGGPYQAAAFALPETCEVRVSIEEWHLLTVGEKCVLVMHEVGHIFGHEHTTRGVMIADALDKVQWRNVPACRRVMKPYRSTTADAIPPGA